MAFQTEFTVIPLAELKACVQARKAEGARYVQTLAVNTEAGVDIIYSFMLNECVSNYKIVAVGEADVVPSITDEFLAAFIWENEIHDLFGITFEGIAIDFGGKFYNVAVDKPMTVISPAQKAAREKAAKLAAAKAAKEKAAAKGADAPADAPAASADAEMEAKLAGMDPEKAAKVRAAMEAKAKKEAEKAAAAKDAEMEAKLAGMDPEKAAKVRAAMEAKAKKAAAKAAEGKAGE